MLKIKPEKVKLILLVLIISSFFGTVSQTQAYNPPIGIPEPIWGNLGNPIELVDPGRPVGWPDQEVVNNYYINNTDPNCTDINNDYGYPNKPRCSLFDNWVLAAGSRVEFAGGPYTHDVSSHRYEWTINGTEQNPVWIIGVPENRPTIAENDTRIRGSYLIFQNIKLIPWGDTVYSSISFGLSSFGSANHFLVRDVEAVGNGQVLTSGGASVFSNAGVDNTDRTHDIVYYNVKIHDFGDDNAIAENDYHGILPGSAYSDHVWVLNSQIYNMGGDSLQIGSNNYAGTQMAHHIYVGFCDLYHNYENAIDVKNCNDVIVSQNKMHDFYVSQGYGYAAPFIAHQQNGDRPSRLWVIYNEIYNCMQGFRAQQFNDVYVVGNYFHHIANLDGSTNYNSCWYNTYSILYRADTFGAVVDNTFDDVGLFFTYPGVTNATTRLSGNIFAGKNISQTYDICIEDAETDIQIDYNDWSAYDKVYIKGSSQTTLSSLQSSINDCANCLDADPLFISVNDHNLQSTSLAKNSNIEDPAYNLFQQLYGINIRVDYNGVPRPQGAAWDMGAYEFVESSGTEIRADVNQDNQITSTDAMLTLRKSLNLDMSQTNWQDSPTTGDVNCDNTTNSTDAMLILRKSLGLDMGGTEWCVN